MKKKDVFVYIAGKYTAPTLLAQERNVLDALELLIGCSANRIKAFCPHTHSKLLDKYAPSVTYDFWMESDYIIIEQLCNCMLMVSNWKDSPGSISEHDLAVKLKYPIFYDLETLLSYVNGLGE